MVAEMRLGTVEQMSIRLIRLRTGSSLVALTVAVGCASTATGVPSLDAQSILVPKFPGIEPRKLRVVVQDKRTPAVADEGATVANVQGAVSEALKGAGFLLDGQSPHELLVMIESAEQGVGSLSNDACIQVHGRLRVESLGTTEALGIGCFEYRHLLGFSLGGGSTEAYRTAINYVLRQFDRQLHAVRPGG